MVSVLNYDTEENKQIWFCYWDCYFPYVLWLCYMPNQNILSFWEIYTPFKLLYLLFTGGMMGIWEWLANQIWVKYTAQTWLNSIFKLQLYAQDLLIDLRIYMYCFYYLCSNHIRYIGEFKLKVIKKKTNVKKYISHTWETESLDRCG